MTFRLNSGVPGGVNSSSWSPAPPPPPPPPPPPEIKNKLDPDFVVILAALLCALICVLGLVAVARCAWIRRISDRTTRNSGGPPPPPNKGLKKKIVKSFPKVTYCADEHQGAGKFSDCAICLAEFVDGDEIRVLPKCGHGFHVGCVDRWLGSHSSCPSCRQILVAARRCDRCGELPASTDSVMTQPPQGQINSRFLP